MSEDIRHPLSPFQQKQVAHFNEVVKTTQHDASLYLQGIVDGLDSPEGTKWTIEGDIIVGVLPTPQIVASE
jgi:hypothetical protein